MTATVGSKNLQVSVWRERQTARAVLFHGEDVALLHVQAENYYKLPGGGVEPGEQLLGALEREVLEEVGADITVEGTLGTIVEYRSAFQLRQASVCYLGRASKVHAPSFTDDELSHGFRLVWVPAQDALTILTSSEPSDYEGRFIVARERIFLAAGLSRLSVVG